MPIGGLMRNASKLTAAVVDIYLIEFNPFLVLVKLHANFFLWH